ncbi:MAG: hypothetical protein J6D28_01885, partial [Bacilli bacterium]|nr:hypothetical protein [Bacilli bacterium]
EMETKEFKKFHVNLSDTDNVCYNNAEEEKYFKFFTLEKIEDLKQLSEGDDILMEAFKSLEKLNNDSMLMSLLEEQELDDYCQRAAMVEQKQLSFDEGKSIGFNEGKNVEFDEGKIEIAKNMLNKKFDLNTISSITGLTKEELENLN